MTQGYTGCLAVVWGVRAHLCAGRLWHLVQAHSSSSSPQHWLCHHTHLFKVAFICPRLCCRQRGLEWALERVGVGPGEGWSELWKASVQSWGVAHTGEEPHPCRAGLEGPRLLCSSQTPTPGQCLARSPHPIHSTRRAEEDSPTARGIRGAGGIQQEVLGTRAQAGAIPCPPVELHVGTLPPTPLASRGWLGGSASPHAMPVPSRPGTQKAQARRHPRELWQERVPTGRACRAP